MEYFAGGLSWIEQLVAERGLIFAILSVWAGVSVVLLVINFILSVIFRTPASTVGADSPSIKMGFQPSLVSYHDGGPEPYSKTFYREQAQAEETNQLEPGDDRIVATPVYRARPDRYTI